MRERLQSVQLTVLKIRRGVVTEQKGWVVFSDNQVFFLGYRSLLISSLVIKILSPYEGGGGAFKGSLIVLYVSLSHFRLFPLGSSVITVTYLNTSNDKVFHV